MRKFFLFRLAAVLASAAVMVISAQQNPNFIKDLSDFPLIEDIIIHEEKYVFTSPSGTVARFILAGGQSIDHYLDLYEKSLPALGWQCQSGRPTTKRKDTSSTATALKDKVLVCVKDGESLKMTSVLNPDGKSAGALFMLDYKPLRKSR